MEHFMRQYPSRYTMEEGFMSHRQQLFMIDFVKKHGIQKILEIGFNGGHGSAALLSVGDDVHVTSVDIGVHAYIDDAKKLIDECFPGRHTLIKGSSVDVLPMLSGQFDCVFVDGAHDDPIPYKDIVNSHKLLKEGGYLIVDDYCHEYGRAGVIQGYNKAVEEKLYSRVDVIMIEDRGMAIAKKV